MKLQKKIANSRNSDFAFEPDILDLQPKELSKGGCLLCLTDIVKKIIVTETDVTEEVTWQKVCIRGTLRCFMTLKLQRIKCRRKVTQT